MKPIVRILALVLTLVLCLGLCACNRGSDPKREVSDVPPELAPTDPPEPKEQATVCGLVGPTGVGLADLMRRNEAGNTALDYTVTLATSPEEIVGKFTAGEVNFAALPTNLAATLYQKTDGAVQVLALNTGCVLYVVENGDSIASVADLKGKTILSTGEGANPEYILRYLLSENGLDPDSDVTLDFVAENDELAAALVGGTADVALVPEPLCSTVLAKNPDLRVALSVGDEWVKTQNNAEPYMGCIVINKQFAIDFPSKVEAFLSDYKVSVETAQTDVKTVAKLCEKYGIIGSAAIAEQALPRCALTCVTDKEMANALDPYLSVLYVANPKSVGGKLPSEGFYYEGFH